MNTILRRPFIDSGDREVATKEIVYTLDLCGQFKFVNAEGERLSGYSCAELLEMTVWDILAPQHAELVRRQIAGGIDPRIGAVFEIEIITRSRERVPLETSVHLVTLHARPVEICGIALPPVRDLAPVRPRCLDPNFNSYISL